ncbi:hypothetical protein BXZ70DRAFT_1060474 [Cristinia sonorae]|uniref:Vacuolar sorting protein Vps3844 C-terminal domain-containing protein n=1 Tax=Cristinia sonorae TaxID=1940300 RepID=A0A8K0UZ98_9AGAR|nr:hypothetical protein BXZ70DRAFT_1060474 [Cristinia sonorae]
MKPLTTILVPVALGLVASTYAAPDTRVFLHPSPLRTANNDLTLTPEEASRTVAKFVGLDMFEREAESEADMYGNYGAGEVRLGGGARGVEFDFGEEEAGSFVGKGMGRTLVIAVDGGTDELEHVIPDTLHLTFSTSAESSPSFSFDWSSFSLPTLKERAKTFYDSIWSSPRLEAEPVPVHWLDIPGVPRNEVTRPLLSDLGALVDFLVWNDMATARSVFGIFDLSTLQALSTEFGPSSSQFQAAAAAIQKSIKDAMAQDNLKLVVLAIPAGSSMTLHKRQQPPSQSPLPIPSPPPQHPISAVSTCFTTLDACTNSTNTCSSHGQCVSATKAGKTCFVCACTPSKSINGNGKTKTTLWAGEKCERVDISQPFVLLVGTVVGLILLVVASVYLLTAVGDEKLPQVLAEGNVPSKRE